MSKKFLLCVFILPLVIDNDVKAAWNYPKKSRRHAAVKYQNDAASYGWVYVYMYTLSVMIVILLLITH